jgi:hypothetical protein
VFDLSGTAGGNHWYGHGIAEEFDQFNVKTGIGAYYRYIIKYLYGLEIQRFSLFTISLVNNNYCNWLLVIGCWLHQ